MNEVLLLFIKVNKLAQSLVPAGFTENWETPGFCFQLFDAACRTQISLYCNVFQNKKSCWLVTGWLKEAISY